MVSEVATAEREPTGGRGASDLAAAEAAAKVGSEAAVAAVACLEACLAGSGVMAEARGALGVTEATVAAGAAMVVHQTRAPAPGNRAVG